MSNQTLFGYSGSDSIYGGDGNDLIKGDGEAKRAGGKDTLNGGNGEDSLYGGAGGDLFWNEWSRRDRDRLDGGIGTDSLNLSFENAPTGVRVEFTGTTLRSKIAPRIRSIERFGLVIGSEVKDFIEGDRFNNLFTGAGGSDNLSGGGGRDTVFGGNSSDRILGGADHDLLTGEEGNDTLIGETGEDGIVGGEGADRMSGDQGNDTISGLAGSDYLEGGNGQDQLSGGAAQDRIVGGIGDDLLSGGDGDDSLQGDAGDDRLSGGIGRDHLKTGSGENAAVGGDGNDRIEGGDEADLLSGEEGNDVILGFGGADKISGGSGDDLIHGGDQNDYIEGNEGNDTLDGGNGRDLLLGGAGADRLLGGEENDRLFGAAENDQLLGSVGKDFLDGGEGDDTADGGSGKDLLHGGIGADVLVGGDDNDRLFGGLENDRLAGSAGNDLLDGGDGQDTLIGGEGNDVLRSVPGDFIDAGTGADRVQSTGGELELGAGNDSIAASIENGDSLVLAGGTGTDFLNLNLNDYWSSLRSLTIVAEEGSVSVLAGTQKIIEATSVEQLGIVQTSGYGDLLQLDDNAAQFIVTGSGLDTVSSGGGNDSVIGAEVVDGGEGDDWIGMERSTEPGFGGEFAENGVDLLSTTLNRIFVEETPQFKTQTEVFSTAWEKISWNTRFAKILEKFEKAEVAFDGSSWNASSRSQGGYDPRTVEDNDSGLNGGLVLIGSSGNVTFTEGIPGFDFGNFGSYPNFPDGGSTINFGFGNTGGTSWSSGGTSGTSSTSVIGSWNWSGWGSDIDDTDPVVPELTLLTDPGETIPQFGHQWQGGAGDDTLQGSAENEFLDGGSGADSMVGGGAADAYVVDAVRDVVVETKWEDGDKVYAGLQRYTLPEFVENLELRQGGIEGTGNVKPNRLTGNGLNNQLRGLEGTDYLIGDAGADTLLGGAESDFYSVENPGDRVIERSNQGISDTIYSTVNYVLPSNVEALQLAGSATLGEGNAGTNLLKANQSISSQLQGGGGDDILMGGTGFDTLIGMNLTTGGAGEVDHLAGGGGSDLFVLGRAGTPGYLGSQVGKSGKNLENIITNGEHAVISDFGLGDQIQLAGTADNYSMGIAKIEGKDCHVLLHSETADAPKDVIAILSGSAASMALSQSTFV